MLNLYHILPLFLFINADSKVNKPNCSECIYQYQRSFYELEKVFSQDSFATEWHYYANTFDTEKNLDIFDQWINRSENETSDHEKREFDKTIFRVDTVFFTYETPSLSSPYDMGLENAIITLKEKDSIYYTPTNSYITEIQDIFTTKNCSYNYSISDFDSLPDLFYCKENCVGINLFVSRIYTNTKNEVISIGIAFSDLSNFNQDDPYTSGNILYATLYMDKFQEKTNVVYSQRIGLKPIAHDTISLKRF